MLYRLTPIILLSLLVMWPASAQASFLLIQETSAESTAQADALAAYGKRPASQYHNAANLGFVEGFDFEFAMSLYMLGGDYENSEGQTTEMAIHPQVAPHLYASMKALDWLTVGLAVFPNFGKIMHWPGEWEADHIVITNDVKTITANANLAFGPFKGFVVAGGFFANHGELYVKRRMTLGQSPEGEQDVDNLLEMYGQGWKLGGNVGLSYQPTDWVRLGVGYRSGGTLSFSGKADFDVISSFADNFSDQNFDLDMSLPHLVQGGVRVFPIKGLSLELDGVYVSWSVYEKQEVRFDEGLKEGPDELRMVDSEPRNLTDGYQVLLGAEYDFLGHYTVRAGLGYDANVVPESSVDAIQPDNHRLNLSAGFGTQWAGFYADVAYMYSHFFTREVNSGNLPGTYRFGMHIVSLSVGYRFDPFVKDDASATPDAPKEDIAASEPTAWLR